MEPEHPRRRWARVLPAMARRKPGLPREWTRVLAEHLLEFIDELEEE